MMSITPTATLPIPQASLPPAPGGSAPIPVTGTLSPSRATDFMTCPLRYRFRVIDKLPERPSRPSALGTLVHGVLERLFDLPPEQRTLTQATAMVEPQWRQLIAKEPELAELFANDPDGGELANWLTSSTELLGRYFELEDPRRLAPAERELYVETVLESGLVLRGYVDRLDIAPSGEIRVVDYKTGRAPSPELAAKALFQLKFYALVLWRCYGRAPRRLQLLYLGSTEVVRYDPDEADLRATQRKIEAVWEAISRAKRTGQWQASPSRLCSWCDHQAICPAFGGTPPPLPHEKQSEKLG